MSLILQEHQKEAYNNVTKLFSQGRFASVVFPTGCGKSFVALKLMEDNPDKRILFLSPTHVIKKQMCKYIIEYLGKKENINFGHSLESEVKKFFPNFETMLYQTLQRDRFAVQRIIEQLRPDFIILDEVHHIKTRNNNEELSHDDANKWGEKIKELLDKYPDAKVLGLTATPERTDAVNVVERLFEGTIASEITLVEALASDKIAIKAPKYVTADYAFADELDGILEQINNCKDEVKKSQLLEIYEQMRKIVREADGISEIFRKNLSKKDGKYIVFCKDRADMEEKMKLAGQWFKDVDQNPEIYAVASIYDKENGVGYNAKQIEAFEKSKSGHLKLLYSIGMLNQGVHISDVSGVVMTRNSGSKIVYLQQLGRALSSDPNKEVPIVFDLVNNYILYNLQRDKNDFFGGIDLSAGKDNVEVDNETSEKRMAFFKRFIITGHANELLRLIKDMKTILREKTMPEELLEVLETLHNEGVNISKIKGRHTVNNGIEYTTLQTLNQDEIDIKDIIEKYGLDPNYPIGRKIANVKSTMKGFNSGNVTEEQKRRFIELGIITDKEIELVMSGQRKSRTGELIDILKILAANGVDVSKISGNKRVNGKIMYTVLKDIKQDGIDVERIAKENGLDFEYSIGQSLRNAKKGCLGQGKYRVTDEEREALIELGIITRKKIEEVKSGVAKSSSDEILEILELLHSNGIDISKIQYFFSIDRRNISTTLKDINQEGIDIESIIVSNGLDPNYLIGTKLYSLKRRVIGTEDAKISEEQIRRCIELGVVTEKEIELIKSGNKKTMAQQLLAVLEILSANGIKISGIKQTKKYGKPVSLKEVKQDDINIQRIIEENGLDPDYLIGQKIGMLKKIIKGKSDGKLTEEERKRFIELGVITEEQIEQSKTGGLKKLALEKLELERINRQSKTLLEEYRSLEHDKEMEK